jgi:hypothetical protein
MVGYMVGPALNVAAFWLVDDSVPHPDGYGYHTVAFGGIQGAFFNYALAAHGATTAPLLTAPLALSFVLPPRISAHTCAAFALLLLLANMARSGGFPLSRHGILIAWGLPLLCIAALCLRAALLYRASSSGSDPEGRRYHGFRDTPQRQGDRS